MSRPYSLDLRNLVAGSVGCGRGRREAARLFEVASGEVIATQRAIGECDGPAGVLAEPAAAACG
jgi:hypothetical protein